MKLLCCIGLVLVSVSLHAQLADFRHTHFSKADSVAEVNSGASLFDLPSLSNRLTQSLGTEEEKFRAIFKWVCNNIDFDFELFLLNHRKRHKYDSPEALIAWNKKIMPNVFHNLVLEKKTVCTGYAWLVQELARHAGLSCVIVDGYGRNASANIRKAGKANHSWNAVKLNGKWYVCDATWASGVHDEKGTFERKYNNAYFLPEPKVFIRDHYPLDSKWTLLEVPGSNPAAPFREFLNGPLIYSSAYQHNITQLYPATFDITTEKDKPVNFRFESGHAMECIELSITKGQKTSSCQPEFFKDDEGLYNVSHTFSEAGRYMVHVRLNNSYAFTYAVAVK